MVDAGTTRNDGQALSGDGAGLSPMKLWSLIRRRWMVLLGALVLTQVFAVIWLAQTTPLYTASAQLLLDPRRPKLATGEAVYEDLGFGKAGMATEMALVRSFAVASRVVDKLKLGQNQKFLAVAQSSSLYSKLRSFLIAIVRGADAGANTTLPDSTSKRRIEKLDSSLDRKRKVRTSQERQAIALVRGSTGVRRRGPTLFLRISFTHSDRVLAARVANAVAEAYLVEQLEARYQGAQRAAQWLSERVSTVRQQLQTSERAVAQHRAKFEIVAPQAGSISDQQASEINAQLIAAHADSVQKRAKYNKAQLILKSGKIEGLAEIVPSQSISNLRQLELETRRREADLRTRYGPEHPTVIKVKAERRDLSKRIKGEMRRVISTLKTDYEFALNKKQSLETSLRQLTGASADKQSALIRLRELQRDVDANKVLYQSLLSRLKEAEQQSNLPSGESRVTEPAANPGAPSSPNQRRTLLMALFAGLAFGLGGALLLEYVESGFLNVEQVETLLFQPVLALASDLKPSERKHGGRVLAIPEFLISKPLSRFSESIRSARVSLQLSDIDNPPRLIMVTSALPAEGKTTAATCIAVSGANAGKRVLIVDCDLRNPALSRNFKLNDRPGLTDLLAAEVQLDSSVFVTKTPNLSVLPAGTKSAHPPDLLGSERMRDWLKLFRDDFDLVIVDAPPVSPVIDSVVLSSAIEKVLFVVRWRSTPRQLVSRAISSLEGQGHKKVAGILLNRVNLQSLSSYSPYYSQYNDSYAKYYTE
ncbi:MAG: polysaccharide biosynthesis tyrosine autokinase [Pseudomonadota bacterium]